MGFRPNYNQQRADRNRAKEAKKAEKLKLLQERTAQRKQGDPVEADATEMDEK